MYRIWSLVLVALLSCVGCGGSGSDAETALEEKSALDVLSQAGEDNYDPPPDQKLTEQQMEMYLKVKAREIELARAAMQRLTTQGQEAQQAADEGSRITSAMEGLKALGSVADVLTVGVRAAQELGYNSAEYQWVKQQILEAQAAAWVTEATSGARRETLAALRNAEAEAATPELKQMFSDQIAQLEQQSQETPGDKDAVAQEALRANTELLQKYASQLQALNESEQNLQSAPAAP